MTDYDAGALYARYAPQIRRYILSRIGDPDLADGLLSDVFERVILSLDTYQDLGWPVSAWIYAIARARTIDKLRQQSRRLAVPIEDWHATIDGPEDAVARRVMQDWVRGAIRSQLDGGQRAVMWCRFVCDLTIEETAARLGLTAGAVKALQHRAIANLRHVIVPDEAMTPMLVARVRAVRNAKPRGNSGRQRQPPRPCAAEGCDSQARYADGYCHRHHYRFVTHGTTAEPVYNRDRVCAADGCGRTVCAAGLCTMHYQRWRSARHEPSPAEA